MTTPRRAVVLAPMEVRRDVIVDMACLADELGYEVFSLPEGWGPDSTVLLTEIATKTSTIRPLAGILSIWGRTPAQMAMAASSLNDVSEGRFILGLGASTPLLAEGFHDVDFDHPIAQLEDTITKVRALLSGDRAVLDDDRSARPLRLMTGGADVPIWLGTLGPKGIELTARSADGWLPAYATYDYLANVRGELEEIRADAGELTDALSIISGPTVSVGETDNAEAVLAFYLCAMGDGYASFVAAQGYADEVESLRAANPKPNPTSCDFPDDCRVLLDQLVVSGDADEVRSGLRRWDEVVDIQTVWMNPGDPWDAIQERLEVCAPA